MIIKKLAFVLVLFFCFLACKEDKKADPKPIQPKERAQENIIDWENKWTKGIGSIDGFKSFGKEEESQRILMKDPNNEEAIIWECIPDNSTVWDGGFMTSNYEIDKDYSYIFVVWLKKTNGNVGKSYTAFTNVEEVNGESVKNAFFIGAGSRFDNLNQWYTLVGYIHPSNYVDNVEAPIISGLYYQGEKVQEGRDFKWKSDALNTSFRVVLNDCKDNEEERLYIWNPQLYKVDGTEPKLYKLL